MTLKQTIEHLVQHAQRSGEVARIRLPKGLTVAVRVEGEDLIDLQLARGDVFPSSQEWKTVIQQWPGQVTVTKLPKAIKKGEVYYLKGQVRMAKKLDELVMERE